MRNAQPPGLSLIFSAFFAFLVLVLGLNSFVVINPGQAGVISVLGKAQDGALLEGIHFKPPLVSLVDVYDVTVQKFEVPAESLTRDLQSLQSNFAINFRIDPTRVVEIRRTQGTLRNLVAKVIAPQTQEAFKIAAALRTIEESITKRTELKQDFDEALTERLARYGVIVLDTSIIDLNFSKEFAQSVEEKQIAEQRARQAVYIAQEADQDAQATINRARGKAEAQRLLAETLKAQGGKLVLQKESIEASQEGGAQMPEVLVMSGDSNEVPFLFNAVTKPQ